MKRLLRFLFLLCVLQSNLILSQSLLVEDFTYSGSDASDITTVTSKWVNFSGTQNPLFKTSGLTYSGYVSSDVGGSCSFTNGSNGTTDGDVKSSFSTISSTSTVYVSFLIQLSASQSTGDYFLTCLASNNAQIGRVYVKTSGIGYFVGCSKYTETATYGSTVLNFLQTYLLVLKYEFSTVSSTDDQCTLYAYDSGVPSTEPSSPLVTIGPIGAGSSGDPSNLTYIGIRQGTNTPTGTIDGIRIATSWSQAPLPVELTFFTSGVKWNKIALNWSTATEVNNYGFEVQRASTKLGTSWKKIGFVQGNGNSNSPKNYSFTDEPKGGKEFQYRLKQIDFDGSYRYSEITTAILENISGFKLDQNYPNPFNPITRINYTLPERTNVKLRVYDLLAQKIAELVNSYQEAGRYEVTFDGNNFPSGAYFYKLEAGDYVEVKKLLLIK